MPQMFYGLISKAWFRFYYYINIGLLDTSGLVYFDKKIFLVTKIVNFVKDYSYMFLNSLKYYHQNTNLSATQTQGYLGACFFLIVEQTVPKILV